MTDNADKQPRLLRERFLRGEEHENLYVTFALYFVIVLMSVMLIFVYLVGLCHVQGTSMNPSLDDGEYVLMLKNAGKIKSGDIITFRGEVIKNGEKVEESLIKRVIGVGGDELVFIAREGTGYVDLYRKAKGEDKFELLDNSKFTEGDAKIDDMLKSTVTSGKFAANLAPDPSAENIEKYKFTVDEGYLFVLGDNRNDSQDSRSFGMVDVKYVRGKMFYKLTKNSILERLLLLIYRGDEI